MSFREVLDSGDKEAIDEAAETMGVTVEQLDDARRPDRGHRLRPDRQDFAVNINAVPQPGTAMPSAEEASSQLEQIGGTVGTPVDGTTALGKSLVVPYTLKVQDRHRAGPRPSCSRRADGVATLTVSHVSGDEADTADQGHPRQRRRPLTCELAAGRPAPTRPGRSRRPAAPAGSGRWPVRRRPRPARPAGTRPRAARARAVPRPVPRRAGATWRLSSGRPPMPVARVSTVSSSPSRPKTRTSPRIGSAWRTRGWSRRSGRSTQPRLGGAGALGEEHGIQHVDPAVLAGEAGHDPRVVGVRPSRRGARRRGRRR